MKKVLELIEAALKALAECKANGPRAESIHAHLNSCASNAKADLAEAAAAAEATKKAGAADPKKEGGFTRLGLMLAVVVFGLLGLACLSAKGDSFGVTNWISHQTDLVSGPTNPVGTRVGGAISVKNQEGAGFFFSGYSTTATNSTLTVKLIRGWGDTSAKQDGADSIQWETGTPHGLLTFAIPIVSSGLQGWTTNLGPEVIRGANWIGIYSITNSAGTGDGNILTNVVMGVNKKIIPIRYP